MGNQIRVVTIGVYGFDESGFFSALTEAGVDTFCDIRRRRGLRGSAYAFANSRRLQDRLASMGIRYVYLKELAPSRAVRDLQKRNDSQHGVEKRERTVLDPAFVQAYSFECLQNFSVRTPIVLTGPEVDKLRQLGQRAWLYVVTFCKGERPRLRIIQDPISRLNPEMLYREIQYLVQESDWTAQGQEIASLLDAGEPGREGRP